MEALCRQCGVHFEVGEELLAQGPVACPTCHVPLIFVQPGTEIPLDPQPGAMPPVEEAPAPVAPAGPADGWGSGDFLWGDTARGVDSAPPSESVPPPAQAVPEAPVEPPPAAAPAEDWSVPTWESPSVPPAAEAIAEPIAEPVVEGVVEPEPQPEVPPEPEQEVSAEPLQEVSPEPLQEVSPEPLQEVSPEPLQEVSPEPLQEVSPEPLQEVSPEPLQEVLPEPLQEVSPEPPQEVSPEPPPVAAQPSMPPFPGGPGGDTDWATAAARWAASGFSSDAMPAFINRRDAQARQAAEGGAPVQPDAAQAQVDAQVEAQVAPPDPQRPPPGRPAEAEADLATPPPVPVIPGVMVSPPPVPGVQPPPLKPEASGNGVPPPLGQRRSVYVMRGSGEGASDSLPPWAKESEPPPVEPLPSKDGGSAMAIRFSQPRIAPPAAPLPAAIVTPLDDSQPVLPVPEVVAAQPTLVPKKRHGWLAAVIVLLLVAAGAYAGWFFYQRSLALRGADASILPAIEPGGPTAPSTDPETPDTPATPDNGTPPPAGDTPATVPSEPAGGNDAVAPTGEEPKPPVQPKAPDEKPGKAVVDAGHAPAVAPDKHPDTKPADAKKKKTVAAVREPPRRDRDAAMEHYKKGNDAIRGKNYPGAIKEFNLALRSDSSFALAHRGLGIAYAQMKQNAKACGAYRKYLSMLPADSKEVPMLKKIVESCK